MHLETYELLKKLDRSSLRVVENFSASAASKLFEQEIREVVSLKFFMIMENTMELQLNKLCGNLLFDVRI